MAIPWMQIVKWMPSVVQVSRELLRRSEAEPGTTAVVGNPHDALVRRVLELEENERQQAQLVNQMAEQLAQFSQVLLTMHRRVVWLSIATAASGVVAIVALVIASTTQ